MATTKISKFTPAMLVLAAACAGAPQPPLLSRNAGSGPARQANPTNPAQAGTDENVHPSSGLVVHIDPVTGRIVPKPSAAGNVPAIPVPQFQSAPLAADSDFVEEASPIPGGGIKVNLKRRFHQPLTATSQPDGRIRIEHTPADTQADSK
jgi:hypothetical protein